MKSIRVELVEAWPDRVRIAVVDLPPGARVRDALQACGLSAEAVGVFGKRVAPEAPLQDGDRVEVYRPLVIDPKEARRRRAGRR